jgi:hypothetical protein
MRNPPELDRLVVSVQTDQFLPWKLMASKKEGHSAWRLLTATLKGAAFGGEGTRAAAYWATPTE